MIKGLLFSLLLLLLLLLLLFLFLLLQVLGFKSAANSSAIADIVPAHADCYTEKEAKVLLRVSGFRVQGVRCMVRG